MSVVTLGTQDKRAVSVRLSDCVLNNIVATESIGPAPETMLVQLVAAPICSDSACGDDVGNLFVTNEDQLS